jgi:hypothetical protein
MIGAVCGNVAPWIELEMGWKILLLFVTGLWRGG